MDMHDELMQRRQPYSTLRAARSCCRYGDNRSDRFAVGIVVIAAAIAAIVAVVSVGVVVIIADIAAALGVVRLSRLSKLS